MCAPRPIGIPDGLKISAVVCVEKVHFYAMETTTQINVEGFTRDIFGEIMPVELLFFADSQEELRGFRAQLRPGAMFEIREESVWKFGGPIELFSPELHPWLPTPGELETLEIPNLPEEDCPVDTEKTTLEKIANAIAKRGKRQRHYFEDDDDVSPSRKVKGLWTYGSEQFGVEKMFVYIPACSHIPLRDLAFLLAQVDGKLERTGRFKRILCSYGHDDRDSFYGKGTILTSQGRVDAGQWHVALSLLSKQSEPSVSLFLKTLGVTYQHAFGTKAVTRPRRTDPVIVIAPHRKILASAKAMKLLRQFRHNVTWVFHDQAAGWSMEDKSFRPEEEWRPNDDFLKTVSQRVIEARQVCDAFTASSNEFCEMVLTEEERQALPRDASYDIEKTLVKKCLHEPIIRFFKKGLWTLRIEDLGARMVHELVDRRKINIETEGDPPLAVEIRQDQLFLEDGRSLYETTFDERSMKIVVAGRLHINLHG